VSIFDLNGDTGKEHLRDTDYVNYLVKQGFVSWTPKKIVFIKDGSKNLFVYETINGRGIIEAKYVGKLSCGYTTMLTSKTWPSMLKVSCLKVLVNLTQFLIHS